MMPGKGENKKRGAQNKAAGQNPNPASDKETPSPDKNESNDVQTGSASPAVQPPNQEKQTEATLTEESKEGASASEMQPTEAEIKPEMPVPDGALALGKGPEIEETEPTEGDPPALITNDDPIAKSAGKEEKPSAAAESIVDVQVEDDKEHGEALKQSHGGAVESQAGLPSDATRDKGSKRASEDGPDVDDGDEGPSKRMRSELRINMRMLLPSKVMGVIIGKAGQTINRLRSDYNVDVSLPHSRGPERILSLKGELINVCDVVTDILPQISKHLQHNGQEVRLLLQQSLADAVVGRGCQGLISLRRDTGCQIRMYSDCAPFSLERVFQVYGSVQQIIDCIVSIYKTSELIPSKDAVVVEYNPDNFSRFDIGSYGGYPEEPSVIRATRRALVEIILPKPLANALVGKDAIHVKQVEKESLTKISLDDCTPESTQRILSIAGTQKQIQYAQYLLQVLIHQHATTYCDAS